MNSHIENISALNSKVDGLHNDNEKLKEDIKGIQSERSSVQHSVLILESKNRTLIKENSVIKDQIYGQKSSFNEQFHSFN